MVSQEPIDEDIDLRVEEITGSQLEEQLAAF